MQDVIFLWSSFGIIAVLVFLVIASHVQHLAHPRERSFLATLTSALLLTIAVLSLLLPALDVALVSSTNIATLGVRKDGLTDARVGSIVLWMKLAYTVTYAIIAIFTVFSVPFSWVYFEEWDDESSGTSRIATATKYVIAIAFTLLVLMAIGLFMPASASLPDHLKDINFDYLKELLQSSRPVKSLLFVLGCLLCLATVTMAYYTATGLSTLPLTLLKTKSAADLDAEENEPSVDLDLNRQKQRQIELRYADSRTKMSAKDRRDMASLQRRERALLRSARLRAEGRSRALERMYRPVLILFGLIYLVLSLLLIITLSISLVRALLNTSACGSRCGFLEILPPSLLLNPINLLFMKLPYFATFILHTLLIFFLVTATFSGVKSLGIRFLWISLLPISLRYTVPQGLLCTAVVMVFAALGLQFTIAEYLVPGYIPYGTQTFCNGTLQACAEDSSLVVSCTLLTTEKDSGCTRSIISRIGAALVANFPGFGIILFWAQFAVLVVFIFSLVVSVFKKNLGQGGSEGMDEDDDEVNERTRLV